MQLYESAEMYLETIYILSLRSQNVRSIDVAEALGYSRPSVSRAVGLLKKDGYLGVDGEGSLVLTGKGQAIAEKIHERHTILTAALVVLGADSQSVPEDACRIEHVISEKTFAGLKAHMKKFGEKEG